MFASWSSQSEEPTDFYVSVDRLVLCGNAQLVKTTHAWSSRIGVAALSWATLAAAFLATCPDASAHAPECSPAERRTVLQPARDPDDAVMLTCSLTLRSGDIVTKRLVLEGKAGSSIAVACGGATLGHPDRRPSFPNAVIEIRSARRGPPETQSWERPTDIRIIDCVVQGPIRIWGMSRNGQGDELRLSSRSEGHTQRAQEAAPTRIKIENATLVARGGTPLYVGPGVTEVELRGSRIVGEAPAIAVYLDAESARNAITGNVFDLTTGREVVAVDGSAFNLITDNRFQITWRGGIYLYRNCGEGGTIRHQTPSHNAITGNRFSYRSPVHLPSIWVGARAGRSGFCSEDSGYPFGSSADDGDNAVGNIVSNNE